MTTDGCKTRVLEGIHGFPSPNGGVPSAVFLVGCALTQGVCLSFKLVAISESCLSPVVGAVKCSQVDCSLSGYKRRKIRTWVCLMCFVTVSAQEGQEARNRRVG